MQNHWVERAAARGNWRLQSLAGGHARPIAQAQRFQSAWLRAVPQRKTGGADHRPQTVVSSKQGSWQKSTSLASNSTASL